MSKEQQEAFVSNNTVLSNRFLNKGTAFTMEEREALGLLGRLPARVMTLEEQVKHAMHQFDLLEKPINQYQLLRNIQGVNNTLYYALLLSAPEKMLPVIYTPTVGEACQKFGALYQRDHGVSISSNMRGKVKQALLNSRYNDVDVIVVTDGSRILGLGDLGANGMGISIGKCSLYVVGAGVHPRRVLPILLDVGTNNEALLNSELYLGQPIPRVNDEEFYGLVEEFMTAAKEIWPSTVIQFEDFSNNHCFDMLEKYQKQFRCFNDDIQGTGAVISAGFANAVKLSKIEPKDQKVLVFGAGSAAVGVAKSIADLLAIRYGTDAKELLKMFYLVDTKGLVTTSRGDKLAAHKLDLARTDVPEGDNANLKDLFDIVKYVKPTALLGLGGAGPVFTKEIIEYMNSYLERPIVFPLSNPTSKAEVIPGDAYQWTNGKAIIASGSPFPAVEVNGKSLKPSQGNNMYIFPGVGLGCSIAQPTYIPDIILVKAAAKLQDLTSEEMLAAGQLYPAINDIRYVSMHIAAAVVQECQALKIGAESLPTNYDEIVEVVRQRMWQPLYESDYHKNEGITRNLSFGSKPKQ